MKNLTDQWCKQLQREIGEIALRLERSGHAGEALSFALSNHSNRNNLSSLLVLREEAGMALKRLRPIPIGDEQYMPVYDELPDGVWTRIVRYDDDSNEILDTGFTPRFFAYRLDAEITTSDYINRIRACND